MVNEIRFFACSDMIGARCDIFAAPVRRLEQTQQNDAARAETGRVERRQEPPSGGGGCGPLPILGLAQLGTQNAQRYLASWGSSTSSCVSGRWRLTSSR